MMGLLPKDIHGVVDGLSQNPLGVGANCGVGASDILASLLDMPAQGVAISPDGRRIVANIWSNIGNIWVRSLDIDGAQPRPLPGGEQGNFPFWSPDSATFAFFQAGQIVAMELR